MRVIFHIGMGKTGSSSLQYALTHNKEALKAQGAVYIGMWFDMLDADYRGVLHQDRFYLEGPERIAQLAEQFYTVLEEQSARSGATTFIMSNEALSGKAHALEPFITALRKRMDVSVIGYVRNPSSWLPSAYTQWGIRDKTSEGAVQPFGEKARTLVKWYRGILEWNDVFPDLLQVRHYDTVPDVVTDFAQCTGLEINAPDIRVLERAEPSEVLLRALFNNRFPKKVLPAHFDRAVMGRIQNVTRLEDAINRYFNMEDTPQILAENNEMFEQYRDRFGIDLLASEVKRSESPDIESVRSRLLDYLVEITLEQARRLQAVERQLNELKQERSDAS